MKLGAFVRYAAPAALAFSLAAGRADAVAAQAPRRVAVGSVSVSGPLPVAEARRAISGAQRAFQQCYDDRLRERAGLAGRTLTRLFVASDGTPLVAQVDESNLGDPALERCIKSAAMVLEFTPHESADSHVRFELRFGDARRPSGEAHTVTAGPEDPEFRTSGARGPDAAGPPSVLRAQVEPAVVSVRGGRPEDQIASGLRRAMPRMRTCYEASLARDRTLAGELQVRFVVDPQGRAQSVRFPENRVGDASLAECIGRVVSTTRFARGARAASEVVARVRLSPPQGLTSAPAGRSG